MKYVEEFRDGALARGLASAIRAETRDGCSYRFMEFCGGHTHAIFRYGIPDLLPPNIHMVHGPGCPVCVLPVGRIDDAIALARMPAAVLCTYGDMLRVPASNRMSLMKARAEGADIRVVYSSLEALRIAKELPDREIVFFAIGFETTTPATALAIRQATEASLKNFSVFSNHVLTPSALRKILDASNSQPSGAPPIGGFVGPAHVSAVIGTRPYEYFAREFRKPIVISGFEPLDILQSIRMLVRQTNEGRAEVENQYTRAVTRDGNVKAQKLVAEIFEVRPTFEWRGLGMIPSSALRIREEYAAFDAERRFDVPARSSPDPRECECGAVLCGIKKPVECKAFGTACTPANPVGACMVSPEGTCAAYYTYGGFRVA